MQRVNYNERSWAIDIISRINLFLINKDFDIKRAGGESSIRTDNTTLFPDVLIFGDEGEGKILQGWELKFPDTDINDCEFIDNAKKKALSLSLNSFLLWNVTTAVLYKINDDESLVILRTWNDLSDIRSRDRVFDEKARILALIDEIIPIINSYLQSGFVTYSYIPSLLSSTTMFELIQRNLNIYASDLNEYSENHRDFADKITIWWRYAKNDFPDEKNKFIVLARNNLFFLLNKFLFAHLLKSNNQRAFLIDNIKENSTIQDALLTFKRISEVCDFWDIFNTNFGEEIINSDIWNDFININSVLTEFQIQKINLSNIQNVLKDLISKNKRKIAGQYATPKNLAKLLVNSTITDINETCLDPCCGSGTIINEIYDYKIKSLNPNQSYDSIWGSDKFTFPLFITSVNFANPQAIGILRKLFKSDAIDLCVGDDIEFHDPYSGNIITEKLPEFDNVISNLPFVKQEDIASLNPDVFRINNRISQYIDGSRNLDRRSDLYSYLPFYFYDLLSEDGRLSIIVSNSWMGTKWGEMFINILRHYYEIHAIIISGKGRWFSQTKVVTNIFILDKKNNPNIDYRKKTKFVTLNKEINNWSNEDIEEFSALINKEENIKDNDISIISYDNEKIDSIRSLGPSYSNFFTDNTWLLEIQDKIIKARDLFNIARGERRGWDRLFYPPQENQIEGVYLKPVLKTPRSIEHLDAQPDGYAFCCTLSIKELEESNHRGALGWIRGFSNQCNEKGLPLPDVLMRPGIYWYTLNPNSMAEMVCSINFGDRLFISKFDHPTFVNQRFITFNLQDPEQDIDICHALLNSILSMFYIEAIGFGRGEGVLDINKNFFENNFHMLNPGLLKRKDRDEIVELFSPLKTRRILPIYEELNSEDRIKFDSRVLELFGLSGYLPKIKKSLTDLHNIRKSVRIN